MSNRSFNSVLSSFVLAIAACESPAGDGAPGSDAAADAERDAAAVPHDAAPPDTGAPVDPGDIAMVLYPGFTTQDLIGPHTVFVTLFGPRVHLVSKTLDPVTSDTGVTVTPTMTFADAPLDLEVLFVPGTLLGFGSLADEELLDFLRTRGARARFVTSVCTGSLFLGAAGLLQGYRATSHWATRDLLPTLGAEPVVARWVEDGNRITGGGVTAGLDFGLIVASRIKDRETAEGIQLLLEYDPAPPFEAGTPETAPPAVRERIDAFLAPFLDDARGLVETAGAAL